MAQGGTLAASPEEDREVGGLSYTCCKQVSPATTWRRLPGREIRLVGIAVVLRFDNHEPTDPSVPNWNSILNLSK